MAEEINIVRQAAGRLGITIGELGPLLGVANRTIYRLSAGEAEPAGPTARLLRLIAAGRLERADLEEVRQ
jgi:DNA-binding transcriptional regulator YiaG